jgi:hypothetical protein
MAWELVPQLLRHVQAISTTFILESRAVTILDLCHLVVVQMKSSFFKGRHSDFCGLLAKICEAVTKGRNRFLHTADVQILKPTKMLNSQFESTSLDAHFAPQQDRTNIGLDLTDNLWPQKFWI